MKKLPPLLLLLCLAPQSSYAGSFSTFCIGQIVNATGSAFWWTKEAPADLEWVRDAKDLDDVSATLVAAFKDDVLMNWFHEDVKVQERLMRTFVNHSFLNGGVLRVKGGGIGVALALEGPRAPVGPISLFLTGQAAVIPSFGREIFSKTRDLLKFDGAATKKRNAAAASVSDKTPIYIFFTGVHPDHQNGKYVQRLLRTIIDIADSEGRPVVTEVQKPENALMAKYLGFKTYEEWTVPDSAPATQTLLRKPTFSE